jgi:two-component system sensor histidine kinase KdpD
VLNRTRGASVRAYLLAILLIAACVILLWYIPQINAVAAAPLLVLAVLLIARAFGTRPALVASTCAALGFSYFFLAHVGFGLEDPNDWVAFLTFTATAVVVGELAAGAERRQIEAEEGRREIEQLYEQLGAAFERASEAEAARRNEQLKAALLDALTHNLRTPLTAIKASVTALMGPREPDIGPGLSLEGRSELLQVIDEESDRLNRFIEALSAADQPDAGKPLSLRDVPLQSIVDDAVTRADTVTRHHTIRVAIDDALPGLSVDPAAVAEVLYILLDNASKYSPPGTTIQIAARVDDDRHVRVSVSDQGPGIPADLRDRVFEKFFRVPGREPFDTRRTGAGLGLPIARRLVEAQSGRIWVEPGRSRGTAFVIMLPTRVVQPAADVRMLSSVSQA